MTPYRIPAEKSLIKRLPEEKHESIVKAITSSAYTDPQLIFLHLLWDIGYKCILDLQNSNNKAIYLGKNRVLAAKEDEKEGVNWYYPIYGLKDRFVAILYDPVHNFKTKNIFVGPYNDNLEEIINDSEIIEKIESENDQSYTKKKNVLHAAYSILMGAGFLSEIYITPELGIESAIGVLALIAASTYLYVKKVVNPSKSVIKEAGKLSIYAKDYLFGIEAYKQLYNEYNSFRRIKSKDSSIEVIHNGR